MMDYGGVFSALFWCLWRLSILEFVEKGGFYKKRTAGRWVGMKKKSLEVGAERQ